MDKKAIEAELDKFLTENPNADTFEIAEHFAIVGARLAYETEQKLPPYYGN
jgi:hypothetical protein